MNQRDPFLGTMSFMTDFVHNNAMSLRDRIKTITGIGHTDALTSNPDGRNHPIGAVPPTSRKVDALEIDHKLMGRKRAKQVKSRVNRKRERAEEDLAEEEQAVEKQYYIKKKRPEVDDGGVELEVYAGQLCALLVNPDIVRAPRGYHDGDHYVFTAASYIKGCKTNVEDGLKLSYLDISVFKASHLRCTILGKLQDLADSLHAEVKESALQGIKRKISGLFVEQAMDDNQFLIRLTSFLHSDKCFDDAELVKLSANLATRSVFIEKEVKCPEKEILAAVSGHITEYLVLPPAERQDLVTIQEMEWIEQQMAQQQVKLEEMQTVEVEVASGKVKIPALDNLRYRRIRNLSASLMALAILKESDCNNTNLTRRGELFDFGMTKFNIAYHLKNQDLFGMLLYQPYDNTFQCTKRDIRYFPILRDASPYFWPTKQTRASLILSAAVEKYLTGFSLSENNDVVSRRLTDIIDHLVKALITYQQAHAPLITRLSHGAYHIIMRVKARALGKQVDELIVEEQRKELLAIAREMITEYLKQYQHKIDGTLAQLDALEGQATEVLGVEDARFSVEDNAAYQALATHPVMQFYKFKTLLKYILLPEGFFEKFAALYIAPERRFIGNFADELLSVVVVRDEVARVEEIRNVLVGMKEFREFLEEHGMFAFGEIMREFRVMYERWAGKEGEHYHQLVNLFDLGEIEHRFFGVRRECGVEEVALLPGFRC